MAIPVSHSMGVRDLPEKPVHARCCANTIGVTRNILLQIAISQKLGVWRFLRRSIDQMKCAIRTIKSN